MITVCLRSPSFLFVSRVARVGAVCNQSRSVVCTDPNAIKTQIFGEFEAKNLVDACITVYTLNPSLARGKAMHSRTLSNPLIQLISRSQPRPNPPCGTVPYLRRSRYHS